MHRHALNQAISLYRGETLTLDQAARHAGVTTARMERVLRSRNVPVRDVLDSPTPAETNEPTPATDPPSSTPGTTAGADSLGNPPTSAD